MIGLGFILLVLSLENLLSKLFLRSDFVSIYGILQKGRVLVILTMISKHFEKFRLFWNIINKETLKFFIWVF